MPRNKKILFLTFGTRIVASSRVRVYNYNPLLEKQGVKVTIIPHNIALNMRLKSLNKKPGLLVKLINKCNHFLKYGLYILMAPFYDVIYIQRILLPEKVFKLLKILSKRVMFDFDDAIYMVDVDPSKDYFSKKDKFQNRFRYIVKSSDCVVVSNERLKQAAYQLNSNITILPTAVDTQRLIPASNQHDNGKVIVGWIGSPQATRYLSILKEVFESLGKKYPSLKMKLVGAVPLEWQNVDTHIKNWSLEEEVSDLQSFQIGIMPLYDDEWAKAKAGYKLLQYMAVGIPCVASPVGVNKDIIQDGINGFLAKTTEDWVEKLSTLIEDKDFRLRAGEAGRKRAEQEYSCEANLPALLKILN